LKKKYIPKLVSAEYVGGFGITEPDAGSDVMAMDSTAEDKGDHWLLNGSKTWISNADVADAVIYYAYTDKTGRLKRAVRLRGGAQKLQRRQDHSWTKWGPFLSHR
jgi:glutaryl-CoA dehydrogenase (non-decarboxylating)